MNFLKKHLVTIILSGVLAVGLGLLIYPSFADYWNSMHQAHTILNYAEEISNMDDNQYEEMIEAARAYNDEIAENGIHWTLTEEERKVVEAENQDRKTVYSAIARQQGATVELVGQRRALQIAERAQAGTRIQNAEGKWLTK